LPAAFSAQATSSNTHWSVPGRRFATGQLDRTHATSLVIVRPLSFMNAERLDSRARLTPRSNNHPMKTNTRLARIEE
jgi:hypothetical protein